MCGKDGMGMITEYNGIKPRIAEDAWIAEDADVIGNVTIMNGSSIFFHSVVRGDSDHIVIGAKSNIQDGCILHTDPHHVLRIGDNVSVGHGAILHGCEIHDRCLIGMGAIVLNGAVIESDCIIGAGAVVTENMHIPQGSLVVGCPAKIIKKVSESQKADIVQNALHYVQMAQTYRKGA